MNGEHIVQHARALVLTAPRTFRSRVVPVSNEPGEQLVRPLEVGLCASDVKMYVGTHPVNRPPLVLGHEFYGEIVEGGRRNEAQQLVTIFPAIGCSTCQNCLTGRQNICDRMGIIGAQRPGAFAEIVAVPKANLLPLNPNIPSGLRILIEPLAVAIHAVRRIPDASGTNCSVIGAGPIGLLISLYLQHVGAHSVTIYDFDPRRRRLAASLLDPHHTTVEPTLSGGSQYSASAISNRSDAVFECVGSSELARDGFSLLKPGGTEVLVGIQTSNVALNGIDLQRGERSVVGTQLYTRRDFEVAIATLAGVSRFRSLPSERLIRRHTLDEVGTVFEQLANGNRTYLKETILLRDNGDSSK